METTLVYISVAFFIGFVLFAYFRYGMTRSISAIYYEIIDDDKISYKLREWIFPLFLFSISVPIIIATWGYSMMTIAGMLIIFTGLAADARDNDITERNHIIGATGGMIAAVIQLFVWQFYVLVGITVLASGLLYWKKPTSHTHYIEDINFAIVAIGILIYFS